MSKSTQINKRLTAKIPTRGNDVTTLGDASVTTSKIADGNVTANKLGTAAVTASKLNSDTIQYILKHYKNLIINGDMAIAQRGTSFAAIANSAYSLDRYYYGKNGSMVHTVSQDTDVPTVTQTETQFGSGNGYLFQNSLRMNLTTAQASIAAGDYIYLRQAVEGYNFRKIAQKPFTLSFWVKSSTTGTYSVCFLNSGTDRSYVAEYTVNVASTWEYKTITVSASPSGGTWNYTNGSGLDIRFILACGTTFQTSSLNSWQSATLLASSNQINAVSTTGNPDFRITGIMVNEGIAAAPFRTFSENFNEELLACKRYYQYPHHPIGFAVSATNVAVYGQMEIEMRTSPTITQSGSLNFQNGVTNATQSSPNLTTVTSGVKSFVINCGNFSGLTSQVSAYLGVPSNNTNVVILTAEL